MEDPDIDLPFQTLRKNLQDKYRSAFTSIAPLPWKKGYKLSLDQLFVERQGQLIMKEDESWKTHDQLIDVDAVSLIALSFHYCQDTQPIVTVEGRMGSGKTTLCKRILMDWASEDIDIMDGICILYVNINDVKETKSCSEKDVCKLFDFPANMDITDTWEILKKKQEDLLVFVDINKTQTSLDWLHSICNDFLPKAKFIIYGRPDVLYKLTEISSVKILLQDFDHEKITKMFENFSLDYYIQDEIFDAMSEDESLGRLCTNPFLCTAFLVTCKEQSGVKCTDNAITCVRTFIAFIWKRFICESRIILNDLDILMTSLSGVFIDIFENGGYLCESDVKSLEHGSLLLESGLLYQETFNPHLGNGILCYSFCDILINEYACALHFSQTLLKQPTENKCVAAILRHERWHTVCRLTASILKQNAYILLDELIGERVESGTMKLFCDCVHQSGGQINFTTFQLREKRKMFEETMDFSNVGVFSTTIKGLKTILLLIQEINRNNIDSNSSTKNVKKYRSCNDIFNELEYDRCELCIRFGSSYACKRCQLANIQKKRKKKERNSMMLDIEQKLKRNSSFKFGNNKSSLNKYSRSLLDLSLSPGSDICRGMSLLNLENLTNCVSHQKVPENHCLKELSLKGSCMTNKIMVELTGLVNSCRLQRLYLMGNLEAPGYYISSKIVDNFISSVGNNLTHLSVNDFHLGDCWMKRLCMLVKQRTKLRSIIVSVSCIHELSVESGINLVQSMKSNVLLENVELYCGIQPMVIMTLFSFYEELLAKDDRLHLVFL